jgi:hypothetical protein
MTAMSIISGPSERPYSDQQRKPFDVDRLTAGSRGEHFVKI